MDSRKSYISAAHDSQTERSMRIEHLGHQRHYEGIFLFCPFPTPEVLIRNFLHSQRWDQENASISISALSVPIASSLS